MKLIWKLTIPQMCLVICIGLISFVVIHSSFVKLRDEYYIKGVVENRLQRITSDIEDRARASVIQASLVARLPVVIKAYEIAHRGNINDTRSPQSQAARELLRKELAPILAAHEEMIGQKPQIHFHLPNGLSLVRLWRDKNTKVDGEWVDISDDISWYRHTVMEVNRSGKAVMGLEPGSGGFAIRGVIPVKTPNGRQLGSVEVLQDFDSLLAAATAGEIYVSVYANKELLEFSVALRDSAEEQFKGDFVRVSKAHVFESLITPELLHRGSIDNFYENRGSAILATRSLVDYSGNQVGVMVCAMSTKAISGFMRTTGMILVFMLACMVMGSFVSLLLGSRKMVIIPLNKIKAKIQDMTEDRADLTEQIPALQKDEIGDLARWFNKLTAKENALLDGLREADERAQSLLDATPLLCVNLWDKNLNIFYCNQVAVPLFGLSNKNEFKDRFFELSPEFQPCGRPSRELALEYIAKAFEEGSQRFEWIHQKLNGDPIPSMITLVRIKHRGDYILLSYVLDLRERHALLDELREESAKFEAMAHWYESILDSIPFPISVQDNDARWTFVNATLEKMLGRQRKDVIGLPCSDWGVSICNTDNCAITCVNRGQKQTYFTHDGASYQVDIEILKNLQGEATGYIEVIQDTTRLEQMLKRQTEAEAASRAKSAFLAKMSHEIRTPINAVLGITEMQLQSSTLSLNTQDAFGKIYNAGYTLLGIINDILDLSKIESGKMELVPARYETVGMISDTVQLNLSRIGSKQIAFNLNINEDVPSEMFGDELRIKQILNNLLSNAFKYTQKGRVDLSISAEYGDKEDSSDVTLVCHVSDTGQGMEDWQVSRLFDEYSRFDLTTNRMIEGTGLGMSITQHLVSMMKGEISVKSDPGEGSSFIVRLPQCRVGTCVLGKELANNLRWFRKTSMSRTKAAQIVREPMPYGNVLIVDDLEINLYVGKGLMAPYGLSIDTALSGFEAIEKIREGKEYDIVFMDHMMPKMDGVETTKILRESGYKHPIVALTANALVGQAEMFLENGFDDFLSKPVDLRQMNIVLNKLIRDKQSPEVIEAARRQYGGTDASGNTTKIFVDPQLARIFARDAEKAVAALEAMYLNKFRRKDDVQIFVINVHAMKNALMDIGEQALANAAYRLEQEGQRENVPAMLEETPAFLNALRTVIENIEPKQEE